MKKIIIPAYVRMFTETIAEVPDDFDVTDGDAVDAVWMEQRNLGDAVDLLEANLDEAFEWREEETAGQVT